jgi:hypothetical protein
MLGIQRYKVVSIRLDDDEERLLQREFSENLIFWPSLKDL